MHGAPKNRACLSARCTGLVGAARSAAHAALVCVIASISIAPPCFGAPAAKLEPKPNLASEPGWFLTQRHGLLLKMAVYITNSAIKLDGITHTWGVLCKAPSWDAICYSRADKTICTLPYAIWSKHGFAIMDGAAEAESMPKNSMPQAATYKKHPVLFMRWTGPAPKLDLMRAQVGPKTCSYTLVTATEIKAPAQAALLLRTFYGLPETHGIAISFTNTAQTEHATLTTQGMMQTQISADTFSVPQGYKVKKTDSDVWINDKDKSDINTFGELLGK